MSRFLHRTIVCSAAWALPATAMACATCFGAPDDPQTKGLGMAMWAMLGVTYSVIGGFGAMFLGVALRARKNQQKSSHTHSTEVRS